VKARLIAALIACIAMPVSASGAAAQGAGTTSGPGGIKDTSPQQRPQDLSVMLHIPWWGGVGIGAMIRYEIPIVPDGFIPAINDQFSLEPSLGFGFLRSYGNHGPNHEYGKAFNISPALYGIWSFHITSKFRPYAALGLGYSIGIELDDVNWSPSYFYFDIAPGLFYKFSDSTAFRAEVGAQGPKVGLSFIF